MLLPTQMDPLTIFHNRIQKYDPLIPNLREYLSENPNITLQMVMEDIQRNPDKKHNWRAHLLAEKIPVKDILAHGFDLSFHKNNVSMFGMVDIEAVIKHPTFPWEWSGLTCNDHITIEDIAAHPDLPWDYSKLPRNKNYKVHPLAFRHEQPVTFYILGSKVTLEDLEQHPDKPWSASCLESPYITEKEELIKLFHMFKSREPNRLNFAKHHISYNPNLNFNDLYELFGTDSEFFHYVSFNPNVRVEDFLKYPQEKWYMKSLSQILPLEFIVEHATAYNWCWSSVMYHNKTITYDNCTDKLCSILHEQHCLENGERRNMSDVTFKMYFKHTLLTNPYMSEADKRRIFEEMDGENYFFTQPFFLEPNSEEIRKYFAGKRIVRVLVEVVSKPEYAWCRRRLERELKCMV